MFDIFKKDKFEEQIYSVYDAEKEKNINVKGIVHNKSLLAIRETKTMGYVIDITVDEDILYGYLKSEEVAKSIILDERIRKIDWKTKGVKERIMNSEARRDLLIATKKIYNGHNGEEEVKKAIYARDFEKRKVEEDKKRKEEQKKQQHLKQRQEEQKRKEEEKQKRLKQQQAEQRRKEEEKKQQQLKQQQTEQRRKEEERRKQQSTQQQAEKSEQRRKEDKKKQQPTKQVIQNKIQEQNPKKQPTNNKKENEGKIKTKQEAKTKDFYVQKSNGMYELCFIEGDGTHQKVLHQIKTYDGAYQLKVLLESMYDWKNKKYPEYLEENRVSGKFVMSNITKVNKGLSIDKKIPKEVMIEMFFSEGNKITSRYDTYLEGMKELSNMIGLNVVKEQIDDLTMQLIGKAKRGIQTKEESLHMLFSGPAGTGKTVIADIVTKILYSLGYLDKKHVVKATREVLVGEHIGSSEKKTIQKIEEAMGGVLFIDEAYSLYKKGSSNDFGIDVVNVLIKEMEDRRGQFIVILAGYEREMEEMISMNPGLKSRIKTKIDFKDYSYEELLKIADITKKKTLQTDLTKEAREYLGEVIKSQMEGDKLDGNARSVRVILENISQSYFADVGRGVAGTVITKRDIEKVYKLNNNIEEKEQLDRALKKLNELYGLKELKESVNKFIKMVQWEKRQEEFGMGKFEMGRMHMAFMGPAGTAKTTVAEIMAEFLTAVGLLKTKKIVNVTRQNLVGEYVGHTAPKVQDVVQRAMGGVLFIDEAYSLVNGPNDTFGNEAVTELIASMEKYKSDFVVILAGYEGDIKKLLQTNEGFNSRIAHKFVFDKYEPRDIWNIMMLKMKKKNYILSDNAKSLLLEKIKQYGEKNNNTFDGNGRWADNEVERFKHVKIEVLEKKGRAILELTKEEMMQVGVEEIEQWYETLK